VKCPKCGAGFVVGEDEPQPVPAKAKQPSPVQKKPAVPVAPVMANNNDDDDDDEGGGGHTYTVQGVVENDGPAVNYAPDMSIRDLRGPAMTAVMDPSNKLIIVGVTGFIGWVAFLVTLIIPIVFPLQTAEERAKERAKREADEQMKRIVAGGAAANSPANAAKVDDDASFLKIGSIDIRGIGELPWYLAAACFLPLILGTVYSGILSMGAVKIQNLEGREWGVASSIMAMVPVNAGGLLCMIALILNITLDFVFEGLFKWIVLFVFLVCVWGLNVAVGIWMLTTLNKPDVIAGFEYVPD
jgi:hypothetical protein